VTGRSAALILALAAGACARGPASGAGPRDAGCRKDAGCGDSVSLNRFWGSAPDDLWLVGDGGLVLHFDGAAWTRVPSGTTNRLLAMTGRGRGEALAVGEGHTILRLRGTTWTREDPPGDAGAGPPAEVEWKDVWMAANGEAWVAGGVRRYDDELVQSCALGRYEQGRWRFDEDKDHCDQLEALWGTGPDDVWARGGETLVHWNGRYLQKHPRQAPPPRLGRHGFAGGWRANPYGLAHPARPAPPGAKTSPSDFWAFGPDDVWAVLIGALSHFDGQRWTAVAIPPP
jgi:hypothetical protein